LGHREGKAFLKVPLRKKKANNERKESWGEGRRVCLPIKHPTIRTEKNDGKPHLKKKIVLKENLGEPPLH